jgi:hypothetical protein
MSMSVRVQPAMAMRPDSEPPSASHRGGGVTQPVEPEALDAGALGSPSAVSARVLRDRTACRDGPATQFAFRCTRVVLAFAEVAQERLGGGLADRDDPAAAAFAQPDGDGDRCTDR